MVYAFPHAVFVTYRRGMHGVSSCDAGWGCTLRCTSALAASALRRSRASRGADASLKAVSALLSDVAPCGALSLPSLLAASGRSPPTWFGVHTAAVALQRVASSLVLDAGGGQRLRVAVCTDATVAIEELCGGSFPVLAIAPLVLAPPGTLLTEALEALLARLCRLPSFAGVCGALWRACVRALRGDGALPCTHYSPSPRCSCWMAAALHFRARWRQG